MKSAYLGQFTDEVANQIAGELDRAGIWWTHKQAGSLTRIFFAGEWGTRLFVDTARLDEARSIAAPIAKAARGEAPRRRRRRGDAR